MPVFEYKCSECNHVTEFLEKADSDAPHPCEKCGSEKTVKVFSTFAARNSDQGAPECRSCPSGNCPLTG